MGNLAGLGELTLTLTGSGGQATRALLTTPDAHVSRVALTIRPKRGLATCKKDKLREK